MKLIHVTDTHLIHPGKTLHGLDPEVRFEACMEDIILNHSDADCLLITGDLADKGEASAYELLAQSLKQYRVPAYLVLGNHDDREVFTKYFPRFEFDENGGLQGDFFRPQNEFVFDPFGGPDGFGPPPGGEFGDEMPPGMEGFAAMGDFFGDFMGPEGGPGDGMGPEGGPGAADAMRAFFNPNSDGRDNFAIN